MAIVHVAPFHWLQSLSDTKTIFTRLLRSHSKKNHVVASSHDQKLAQIFREPSKYNLWQSKLTKPVISNTWPISNFKEARKKTMNSPTFWALTATQGLSVRLALWNPKTFAEAGPFQPFFYFYIFIKCFLHKYIFGFTIYSFIPLPPWGGAASSPNIKGEVPHTCICSKQHP